MCIFSCRYCLEDAGVPNPRDHLDMYMLFLHLPKSVSSQLCVDDLQPQDDFGGSMLVSASVVF